MEARTAEREALARPEVRDSGKPLPGALWYEPRAALAAGKSRHAGSPGDPYPATRLFIDGAWRDGAKGRLDVLNPATGEAIGALAHAGASDLDDAPAAGCPVILKGPEETPAS